MSDLQTLSCTELIARIESLEHGLANYSGQLNKIQNNMAADGWYHDGTDKAEILTDLCDILGITPTQTVSITATISISVSAEVPLNELDDFDADGHLSDWLSVDMSNGDSSVDDWSVDIADWEAQ